MDKKRLFTLVVVAATLLGGALSCRNKVDPEGANSDAHTLSAENVTETGALLKGAVSSDIAADVTQVGFIYGIEKDYKAGSSPRVTATLDGFSFEAAVKGLAPGTTYAYQAFATYGGKDILGEKRGFTTKAIFVSDLKLDKTSAALTLGKTESVQLTATVTPANASNAALAWTSSNEKVATVTQEGLVKAVAKGSADITVQTTDGSKKAVCKVTVDEYKVTGITLDQNNVLLQGGIKTLQLKATVTPADAPGSTVSWTSDAPSIATVSSSGLVTALGNGVVRITASAGGYEYVCRVIIMSVAPEAVDLGLSVKWASCNLGANSSSEPGFFFDWGASVPYEYNKSASAEINPIEEYPTLPTSKDTARKALGGTWRMPAKAEVDQLINNCTWTHDGNKGFTVTGPNGKSIYLGVHGFYNTTTYRGGDEGFYWTSSVYKSSATIGIPYFLEFSPSGGTRTTTYKGVSNQGYMVDASDSLPIRPVCN